MIRVRLGIVIALSTLFFLLSAAVTVAWITVGADFEREIPEGLLDGEIGVSPTFYAYRFSDRENRRGEREDVTDRIFAQKKREYVPYSEIPENLVNAFVAIEDKDFFTHRGVDWKRTASAVLNLAIGYSDRFGASTITQQLVKNLTGKNEISVGRKIQELMWATDLERKADKTQIMERYLNIIHFSDSCDGIAEAARHYFSKSAKDLTLCECASIAAITNSPAYYNPIRHPENHLKRRDLILSEMCKEGYITREEYDAAVASPIGLAVTESEDGVNSWYADLVIEDVINDLMKEYGITRRAASEWVQGGGLRIDTAMNPEMQEYVEEYYRTAVVLPKDADGKSAQSALIVIHPQTGDILAVAGAVGRKTGNRIQNFATQTKRPPGSTIKPIAVYAPAIERGIITWGSVYDDAPVTVTGDGTPWPQNATREYAGKVGIPYAVAHSLNTVPVRLLRELGQDTAFDWAKNRFHLSEMTDGDNSEVALALGQFRYGVTLRDLTAAYTVFADGGIYHPTRSYYRVTDSRGHLILSNPDAGETVLSAETAAVMTKLLEGVITDGTSSSITLGDLTECAGKTGTSSDDFDRWFVGYTPELLCGVWCGYEYPEPLIGRNLCTSVWNRVMRYLTREYAEKTVFDLPATVVQLSYCAESGDLPTEACEHRKLGWFTAETAPRDPCVECLPEE